MNRKCVEDFELRKVYTNELMMGVGHVPAGQNETENVSGWTLYHRSGRFSRAFSRPVCSNLTAEKRIAFRLEPSPADLPSLRGEQAVAPKVMGGRGCALSLLRWACLPFRSHGIVAAYALDPPNLPTCKPAGVGR